MFKTYEPRGERSSHCSLEACPWAAAFLSTQLASTVGQAIVPAGGLSARPEFLRHRVRQTSFREAREIPCVARRRAGKPACSQVWLPHERAKAQRGAQARTAQHTSTRVVARASAQCHLVFAKVGLGVNGGADPWSARDALVPLFLRSIRCLPKSKGRPHRQPAITYLLAAIPGLILMGDGDEHSGAS